MAQITKISAMGELVIQFLDPFKIQDPSFYCSALVSIELGSEPTLGSVNPKHPTASPAINSGKYLSFNSFVPNL